MGLEPTTFGITIRRSNQLSYIYRVVVWERKDTTLGLFCKKRSEKCIWPTQSAPLVTASAAQQAHSYGEIVRRLLRGAHRDKRRGRW